MIPGRTIFGPSCSSPSAWIPMYGPADLPEPCAVTARTNRARVTLRNRFMAMSEPEDAGNAKGKESRRLCLSARDAFKQQADRDEIFGFHDRGSLREPGDQIAIRKDPHVRILLLRERFDGPAGENDRGLHGNGVDAVSGEHFVERTRRFAGLADRIGKNLVRPDHE